jgi:SAM-dependent methyltransferase
MVALLERFPPTGPVLDVGCGSGDLSIYLARLGYQVIGVDFVEKAIESAREKRSDLPPEQATLLDFRVADALQPARLGRAFGAVVDSGFLHLFDPDQCDPYIQQVGASLQPHGRFYLHEFAIEFPVAGMPRRVSEDELRAAFSSDQGWSIKEIRAVDFLSRVAPPVPAICACIERLPD